MNTAFAIQDNGLEEMKLGEICEVKDGTHDSPSYIIKGIPFVTQKNVKNDGFSLTNTKYIATTDHEKFYKRSNVAFGDILISMIGANRGMACIVNVHDVFSIKNVCLVKSNDNVNHKYLLYYFNTIAAKEYVKSYSKGGAQEFIGLTELRKFPILYGPLSKQAQIVSQLDALFAETKSLESIYRQKLADLDELKKSLLQKAFAGEL